MERAVGCCDRYQDGAGEGAAEGARDGICVIVRAEVGLAVGNFAEEATPLSAIVLGTSIDMIFCSSA